MGKKGKVVFNFFFFCAAFNISHLAVNYSLIRVERRQKINPHFDPICGCNNNKVILAQSKIFNGKAENV